MDRTLAVLGSSARASAASAAVFARYSRMSRAELSRGAQRTIVVALLTHTRVMKLARTPVYTYDAQRYFLQHKDTNRSG